ncbi:MAG: hypothetical protein ACP5NF_10550 [Thermoanaerobaculum sp.]
MRVMAAALRSSASVALGAGLALAASGRAQAAAALTVSWLAVTISALWLEHLLWRVLQPGRPRLTKSLAWQAVARMAFLLGVAAVLFVLRRDLELWAVGAGVTVAVVGWVWAGLKAR